jgi:hypothetical protein
MPGYFMIILGLNAFHGDSAAALVKDGRLIAAAEEVTGKRVPVRFGPLLLGMIPMHTTVSIATTKFSDIPGVTMALATSPPACPPMPSATKHRLLPA